MKTLKPTLCLLLAISPLALAKNDPVVIDAANGNTHLDVQAALDAYPAGTTFRMIGTFLFSDHVHIEKSGTRILGDYVDTNGDGRADENDTWNTVIERDLDETMFLEGFKFLPRDEVGSAGYFVSDVQVSGIRFSRVNVPMAAPPWWSDDQVACRTTPLPYELSNVELSGNWFESGGIYVYRSVSDFEINGNLFSVTGPNEGLAHAVEMKGWTVAECGLPFGIEVQGQERLSITDNTFRDGRDVSLGFQSDLLISGNVMTGTYSNTDNKLWLELTDKATIEENHFEGGPGNSGILVWSASRTPGLEPGRFTEKLDIHDNRFVDTEIGILTWGGIIDSTIKDNEFSRSGTHGPVGSAAIVMSDVGPSGAQGAGPSDNVTIKRNDISGAGATGIALNGETTGVTLIENRFANPLAVFGDVFLMDQDYLYGFGEALCPANDNKVIAEENPVVVVDFYTPRCPDREPNKLLGSAIIAITP